jgi:hypothetical protein
LKGLGWIDGGDSWTLPSTVTSESATAGAALIQAKIDYLKVFFIPDVGITSAGIGTGT